jgi:hypothetical protein
MTTGSEPLAETLTYSWAWDAPEPLPAEDAAPTPWVRVRPDLERAREYWLATTRRDGSPHIRPVLAVMTDDLLYFCANDRSAKARNLAIDPRLGLTARTDRYDLVVEGRTIAVDDQETLDRVAAAYAAKYGWRPTARAGALWADGAPTADPPPYRGPPAASVAGVRVSARRFGPHPLDVPVGAVTRSRGSWPAGPIIVNQSA